MKGETMIERLKALALAGASASLTCNLPGWWPTWAAAPSWCWGRARLP